MMDICKELEKIKDGREELLRNADSSIARCICGGTGCHICAPIREARERILNNKRKYDPLREKVFKDLGRLGRR